MTANLTGVSGEQIIKDSIDESGGNLDVLQASPNVLSSYIRVASENRDDIENMRILAGEEDLKEVMRDFLISSAASDLIKDGKLELLSTSDSNQRSLAILNDKTLLSFVDTGDSIGSVASEESELVDEVVSLFGDMWDDGKDFKIRTPPISDVRRTLREEIGEETQEDFSAMLDTLETAKGDGEGLDEITVALLAAAKNNILLYDISKWGEDSGVASKATFSRKKTEMETRGLIDTENVPIDIGRPRLRLQFADDELQDATLDEIVEVAKKVMS